MPFPADITPVNATDLRFGDALAVAELPVIMEIKQSRAGGEDLMQGRTAA